MKPKPTPKHELIAEIRTSVDMGHTMFIRITCHSRDASEFLAREAVNFGWLRNLEFDHRVFDLYPNQGYDIQEIAEYLNSYNEKMESVSEENDEAHA